MGINFSTINYKNIIKIVDNNENIDMLDYGLNDVNYKLIYKHKEKSQYLYFDGDINYISKINYLSADIDEASLLEESIYFENLNDLHKYIESLSDNNKDIKSSFLKYYNKYIELDLNYIKNLNIEKK